MMSDTFTEAITRTDGLSFFDIRGDGFDTMLFVNGQPIGMNWYDCGGSIAQYLVRAGVANRNAKLAHLRYLVAGNLLVNQPLSTQLWDLLELFAPGDYSLTFIPCCPDSAHHDFSKAQEFSQHYDWFYPFGRDFVFTRPSESLSEDQIAFHAQQIANGLRPIAITANVADGQCDYVIDGHHKLVAYRRANVDPAIINICRYGRPPLPPNTVRELFARRDDLASHYEKHKGKTFQSHVIVMTQ